MVDISRPDEGGEGGITELDAPQTLSVEHRHAVVLVMLARYDNQTPAELGRLVQRLILTVDRAAAQARRNAATRGRQVASYSTADGQGALHAVGPLEQIAAITARLRAELAGQSFDPGDIRTMAQREFDLLAELLTRGTIDDQAMPDWHAQVVVPFSIAEGGELEVAEIPGLGPILPSTARDLLEQSSSLTQIAVDEDGNVLAVSTPTPGPAQDRSAKRQPHASIRALAQPPVPSQPGSLGYRPTRAMVRHLEVRDRACVFPGCHRRVTDKDHRIPWPLGPTNLHNLQCLCRHHHRAKQAVFRVELSPDGDYLWMTRGDWVFVRRRHRY